MLYMPSVTSLDGIITVPPKATGLSSYRHTRTGSVEERTVCAMYAAAFQAGDYTVVHCEEHNRAELVPRASYYRGGLQFWRDAGLHPRFSVYPTLARLGFRYYEQSVFVRHVAFREALVACAKSRNPEAVFCRLVADQVPVWLTVSRQRIRVTAAFKRKYKARSFTLHDYETEPNMTLRNLMLRRGVEPGDVAKGYRVVLETTEGSYLAASEYGPYYLRVACPSTGEVYVLQTLRREVLESRYPGVDLVHAARLASFNLPANATFVDET